MKKTILDEVVFILFLSYKILHADIPSFFYGKDRKYRASQTLKRHQSACNICNICNI